MSGIAELLANLGYEVSGSDVKPSTVTERLATLGVTVHEGHRAEHVEGADVVVVSSAIRPGNPEVLEAHRRQLPVIPRAEMLAELMRLKCGIAVAGAHGKTTTTSMIAVVLEGAGLDPTAVIGGRLGAFGSNARLGRGDYLVAEADESDRSFLRLSPVVAVVTNIDREHLENYDGSFERVLDAFVDFANKVPFYGTVIACIDDEHVRGVVPRITRRIVTYGTNPEANVRAVDVACEGFGSTCRVIASGEGTARGELGRLALNVPGRHNALNALAAVAVGLELGVPFGTIASTLAGFQGVERRFQRIGHAGGVTVVDDYGHHPTEIAAVVAAARAVGSARLILVFQPHRYSRTAALLDEFGRALALADEVVLTDVYSAGEDPLPGITADAVADAVRRAASGSTGVSRLRPRVVRPLEAVPAAVAAMASPGDLVVTLGAGSIGGIAPRILEALSARTTGAGGSAGGHP